MPAKHGKLHWTQTPKGKRILEERSAKIAAEKRVASTETETPPPPPARPKRPESFHHAVTLLSNANGHGLVRQRVEIKSWGELIDLLMKQDPAAPFENINIDCNI